MTIPPSRYRHFEGNEYAVDGEHPEEAGAGDPDERAEVVL